MTKTIDQDDASSLRTPKAWWRWPGIRLLASSVALASTPRSTSRTAEVVECFDLIDLPRLFDLHERQGSTGRPLHHQPDLRNLRRQPCTCSCYARTWRTG